jgi:cell division protein FtsL
MSLCYDGEKWLMITLSIVAISLTIGLVFMQYAHGQDINQTSKIPTGKFESKAFTIKDLKAVYHDGDYEISGTIKNIILINR